MNTAQMAAQQQSALPVPSNKDVEGLAMLNLTSYVHQCYWQARSARTIVTQRLLQCERQRRGVYDPARAVEIRKTGGTDIYMMLTDIKCRAAEAWINDVLMNGGEKSWGLDPNSEPDLPANLNQQIIKHVQQEVQMLQEQTGQGVLPEAVYQRMDDLYHTVHEKLKEQARTAADLMEEKIEGILEQAKFDEHFRAIVYDFVTYPTCILKGPIMRKKPTMTWGPKFTPQVEMKMMRDYYRVSPYDAFPCPQATGAGDEFFIERSRLNRKNLQGMIGQPGSNDDEIRKVLELYGRNGLKNWQDGDSEHERLEGKQNTYYSRGSIECIEFWGAVSGDMLLQWGMKGLDPYTDYEVNLWTIGPYTVRAIMNPDPLGRRPYETASFINIPGAFWGMALPEVMSDVQIMCNAAARALGNNMAIASGPQVEVDISRLPPGEPVTQMYPWKIWQTTGDRTGGGQAAIRFFQPDMNAEQLMAIYQYFARVADEVTGVPNYIYGSNQASGAGRTASGLSMLMENAGKGIKNAILNLDKTRSGAIQRTFEHIMIYDPDSACKGDMKIKASGSVATLIKDNVQARRQEFLQTTLNPIDSQIMGMEGRANLLRKMAASLDMNVDDIIPTPEEIGQKVASMNAQAAAMASMQNGQPAPQPA
jgi:hypothetical protein